MDWKLKRYYNIDMKICKDGRIWGQNNKEAKAHLGQLSEHSLRQRETQSQSKMGKKNPMYGKHHTEETRKKQSQPGDKSPNWKGGVTPKNKLIRQSIEYRLWREAVFARDNWTCQNCGKREDALIPHHIKSFAKFPELRFAIDNGKTLCFGCHKLTENWCGKGGKK